MLPASPRAAGFGRRPETGGPGWRAGGPWVSPRLGSRDQAGEKFERKKQRAVREAAGRIPAGPGRVEAPASGSLPRSRFSGKGWAPGTVLGADGTVTPASGLVPFTEPKCVHVLLLRLHSLVFPAGIY